jgi:hypothetical protein
MCLCSNCSAPQEFCWKCGARLIEKKEPHVPDALKPDHSKLEHHVIEKSEHHGATNGSLAALVERNEEIERLKSELDAERRGRKEKVEQALSSRMHEFWQHVASSLNLGPNQSDGIPPERAYMRQGMKPPAWNEAQILEAIRGRYR